MTSGELLREYRKQQKLSLRAVSLLAGVSHTQIADLENSVNFGTIERIERILKALDVGGEQRKEYYLLRGFEMTPPNVKKELQNLKIENQELREQLIIQNNSNNGDIIVGKSEKVFHGSDAHGVDLSGLNEDELQQVKNFVSFLKSQK